MRSRLTSLNADIQQRATFGDLSSAFSGTSNNSQPPLQDVINKVDELINALRR